MKVSDLKDLLALRFATRTNPKIKPLYLEGSHGVGKTAAVKQLAKQQGVECRIVCLAGFDGPDFTGIPYVDNGVTKYGRPAWMPSSGDGILFFDEANRAPMDSQQPLMSLLTDRKFNGHELPAGWLIVFAGNPDNGQYSVGALDIALNDRVSKFQVEKSHTDVVNYLSEAYPRHPLLGFVAVERNVSAMSPRSIEALLAALSDEIMKSPRSLALTLEAEVGTGMGAIITEYLRQNERFTLDKLRNGEWKKYQELMDSQSSAQTLNDLLAEYCIGDGLKAAKALAEDTKAYNNEVKVVQEWVKNTANLESVTSIVRAMNNWLAFDDSKENRRRSLLEFSVPFWCDVAGDKKARAKIMDCISESPMYKDHLKYRTGELPIKIEEPK